VAAPPPQLPEEPGSVGQRNLVLQLSASLAAGSVAVHYDSQKLLHGTAVALPALPDAAMHPAHARRPKPSHSALLLDAGRAPQHRGLRLQQCSLQQLLYDKAVWSGFVVHPIALEACQQSASALGGARAPLCIRSVAALVVPASLLRTPCRALALHLSLAPRRQPHGGADRMLSMAWARLAASGSALPHFEMAEAIASELYRARAGDDHAALAGDVRQLAAERGDGRGSHDGASGIDTGNALLAMGEEERLMFIQSQVCAAPLSGRRRSKEAVSKPRGRGAIS
jgi:hypothetical protein